MKNRKAFTLIELLVVVSIIALLIALLLPSLAKAKENANLVRCQANLHAIGIALSTYTTQNKDLMPQSEEFYLPDWWHKLGPDTDLAELSWCEALVAEGDVNQRTNRSCAAVPGGSLAPFGATTTVYPAAGWDIFMCPKHAAEVQNGTGDLKIVQGYGLAWLATSDFDASDNPPSPTGRPVLIVVARNLNPNHIIAADGWETMGRAGSGADGADNPSKPYPAGSAFGVFERHKVNSAYGANYLLGDNHVEWSNLWGKMQSPRGCGTNSTVLTNPHSTTTPPMLRNQKVALTSPNSAPPNDMWVHP